jgi:RHS repeat-associated protein
VVWQWDNSDPFGANIPNENPNGAGQFSFNLRFPGQYFDKETGLHYNFYRDGYNPEIGAYTQSDPIGLAGGINGYAYVGGDPISYIDPRGLNPVAGATAGAEIGTAILPGIGTVVGAVVGAAGGYLIADQLGNLIYAKPGNESRPPTPRLVPNLWINQVWDVGMCTILKMGLELEQKTGLVSRQMVV